MTREEYFIEARDAFYTLNDLKKYNIPKEVYDNICAQFYALGASYNEQPSLPSNLAEAEFEYMKSLENAPADQREDLMICDAFKAGVLWMAKQHANDVAEATESAFNAGKEWMTKQGFISEGIIYQTSGKDTIIELNEHIGYLEDCDEVIVNIRKK